MSHLADVPGLSIGHAIDETARSGVTAIVFDAPSVCGVSVVGGAPGTRETDCLRPGGLAPGVDAICLSGGSAFGVAAGDGAQRALLAKGRGFALGSHRIPIVPGAVVFDLSGPPADFRALGEAATYRALDGTDRRLGTVGAGYNATTARLKGGVGSAAERVGGATVGAIVVVNAVGTVTVADTPHFRAAGLEHDGEFGGLGVSPDADYAAIHTKVDAHVGANTTIALIATDQTLSLSQANRLALSAHDGMALATYPAHTMFDGDTIFAASTGRLPREPDPITMMALEIAAVRALARAIARGVYEARAVPGDTVPTWHSLYGQ